MRNQPGSADIWPRGSKYMDCLVNENCHHNDHPCQNIPSAIKEQAELRQTHLVRVHGRRNVAVDGRHHLDVVLEHAARCRIWNHSPQSVTIHARNHNHFNRQRTLVGDLRGAVKGPNGSRVRLPERQTAA